MISVIVPVYKVEKYLDKCVQSILGQTYSDFELILVDDGSPDDCPRLCDEYAQMDKRVKVIHKTNGGLSDARNMGVNQAKGEYVTFIDSDDYVSFDYLETLWGLKEKYGVDISVGGICTFYEGYEANPQNRAIEHCYDKKNALKHMLYQRTMDTSACAILLPTYIARKYPFPYGKYHEDEFTTYKYYSDVNMIAVTTKSLYFYMQRKGSIMHVFGQASLDELEAADNLVSYCEKYYPDLVKAAHSKKFSDYCQVFLSIDDRLIDTNQINEIKKYISVAAVEVFKDDNARIKNRVAAFCVLIGFRFFKVVNKLTRKVLK